MEVGGRREKGEEGRGQEEDRSGRDGGEVSLEAVTVCESVCVCTWDDGPSWSGLVVAQGSENTTSRVTEQN